MRYPLALTTTRSSRHGADRAVEATRDDPQQPHSSTVVRPVAQEILCPHNPLVAYGCSSVWLKAASRSADIRRPTVFVDARFFGRLQMVAARPGGRGASDARRDPGGRSAGRGMGGQRSGSPGGWRPARTTSSTGSSVRFPFRVLLERDDHTPGMMTCPPIVGPPADERAEVWRSRGDGESPGAARASAWSLAEASLPGDLVDRFGRQPERSFALLRLRRRERGRHLKERSP